MLEIPTPRWTTFDANKLGFDPPAGAPARIQQRAWTSPIWYTPDPSIVKKAGMYSGLVEKLRPSHFDPASLQPKNSTGSAA